MIGLATGVSSIKIAVAEGLVLKAGQINKNNMHMEMDLIEQDKKILLQLTVLSKTKR